MARISDDLRQQIEVRAYGLCEYCQTAQLIVVTMEVDHIIPQKVGGLTDLDNLCFVCRGCNSFKQDFQTGFDPEKKIEVRLFNPRIQQWQDHFRWSDDGITLIGLTPTGRATLSRLKMNRDDVLLSRALWVKAGWHPPKPNSFPAT